MDRGQRSSVDRSRRPSGDLDRGYGEKKGLRKEEERGSSREGDRRRGKEEKRGRGRDDEMRTGTKDDRGRGREEESVSVLDSFRDKDDLDRRQREAEAGMAR